MQTYLQQIKHMPLFEGIQEEHLQPMLDCLGSYLRTYEKNQFLLLSNESVHYVGLVLEGTVHMIKEDINGHKTILAVMKTGELFGETFACGNNVTSAVTFSAASNCKILFLPFHKVFHSCKMSCRFHHRLIENIVMLIAAKNVQLMEKVEVISKKTLREKIYTYLSIQKQHNNKPYFELPLGRSQLAEYLCADRSALTRELSKMRAEGLIDFEKNIFCLKFENQ